MKKSFMRAALPTMAMLLVAIMTLTGVTFAWFSNSYTADVAEFDVKVQTADGLLVSADYKVWKTEITTADIDSAQPGFLAATSSGLIPCSTTGTVTGTELQLYSATLTKDGEHIENIAKATSGYIVFDLYFQNAGAAKTITVTPEITNRTGGLSSSLAARMAIIKQGEADIGVQITDGGTTATIWEANPKSHTEAGLNDYNGHQSSGVASDAIFKYLGIAKAGSGAVARYEQDSDGVLGTVTPKTGSTISFDIGAAKAAKVTFIVWIDGQDADCLNDVAGKALQVNVSFSAPQS